MASSELSKRWDVLQGVKSSSCVERVGCDYLEVSHQESLVGVAAVEYFGDLLVCKDAVDAVGVSLGSEGVSEHEYVDDEVSFEGGHLDETEHSASFLRQHSMVLQVHSQQRTNGELIYEDLNASGERSIGIHPNQRSGLQRIDLLSKPS
jgi:hypothetical protein